MNTLGALCRRWDKDYLILRAILSEGLLNRSYSFESRVQGSRQATHGWRGYKMNGGGMVLDWGVHMLDQMLDLIPEKVTSVCAHLHYIYTKEVEDNFTAMLRFESGISALVSVAMNCFILQPRWHVSCADGTAVIDNWECEGRIVKLTDDPSAMEWSEDIIYTAAGPTRSMAPRPNSTTVEMPLPTVTGSWTQYYLNILDALAGKAELTVKPEQALRVMRVIDAIFLSDKTGAPLNVSI